MNNIKLKFDIGAILILKEHGYDMFKMKLEEMNDIQYIVTLIYATAIRGGSNITLDDIKNMSLKQVEPLVKQLEVAMKDGMEGVRHELFQFDKRAVN